MASKILIADDSLITQNMLKSILKDHYDLTFARDGKQAMDLINANEFDLLILDLGMPVMDGFKVLEELNAQNIKLPTIVITSLDESENEARVLKLGAVDFINKPFSRIVTFQRVNNIMKRIEADKRAAELAKLQQKEKEKDKFKIISQCTHSIYFEWTRKDGVNYFIGDQQEFKLLIDNDPLCPENIIHPDDLSSFKNYIDEVTHNDVKKEITVRVLKNDRHYLWCRIFLIPYFTDNKLSLILGTIADEHEKILALKENEYLASHDVLTGLYNQRFFASEVEDIINKDEKKYAIIAVDIKNFKLINNVFGFAFGDELLIDIGNNIQLIAKNGIVSRGKGDVFYILDEYEDENEIVEKLNKLNNQYKEYVRQYKINLLFGIYLIKDKTVPVNLMCDKAISTINNLKKDAISYFAFYDNKFVLNEKRIIEIERQMQYALDNEQFEIYMQPKYDIINNKIIGAESLIRWNHPEKGLIAPNDFLPVFEQNGFIVKLDEYVWKQTAKTIKKWMDNNLEYVPVSVNVSRKCLFMQSSMQVLSNIIKETGIDIDLIELEITETIIGDNYDEIMETIRQLSNFGFSIAIDDFGSGYSSLNFLKDSPTDVLKINKNMVDDIIENESSRIVLSHVISMANELHYRTVAEGVEFEQQVNILKDLGCHIVQGYYYSRPIRICEFEKLLNSSNNSVK